MRFPSFLMMSVGLLLLAACTSPESRIARNQAAFDRYPVVVQEKIRAGRVAIGFSPEMVRIALGEPTRKFNLRSDKEEAEVWSYDESGPHFSFGLGASSGGSPVHAGAGLEMSSDNHDFEEKIRIEFCDGKVSRIETIRK